MKIQLVIVVLLLLLLGLGSLQTALAQDEDRLGRGSAETFTEPLVPEPKYAFSGALVVNSNVTVTHCTNLGETIVPFEVRLFDYFGNSVGSLAGNVQDGQTYTMSFGIDQNLANLDFYVEDGRRSVSEPVSQGHGIIRTDPSTAPVICEAVVVLREADGTLQEVIPLNVVPVSSDGVPTSVEGGYVRCNYIEGINYET